jgi:hypothetical protein
MDTGAPPLYGGLAAVVSYGAQGGVRSVIQININTVGEQHQTRCRTMTKDALSYLKSEIRASIVKDVIDVAVYHARRQRVKDGGHFSIPRQVFCYVDHLGHIAYGGNSTARAVRFIKEFFPARYRDFAELAHSMWRHGTVHQYKPICYHASFCASSPKIIVVKWISSNHDRKKERNQNMLPFPMEGEGNVVCIVMNTCQLADDLLIAVDEFITRLKRNSSWKRECGKRIEAICGVHDYTEIRGVNMPSLVKSQMKLAWNKKGGLLDKKYNVVRVHPAS